MKKNLLPLFIVAFSSVFAFSSLSMAQTLDLAKTATSGFRSVIIAAEQACEDLHCVNSSVQAYPLSERQMNGLGQDKLQKLLDVCQNIAETEWPETILEGPYVASFHVQITKVQILTYDQGFLGYWVTYEDKAWNTENCNYDPRTPSTLNSCESGKFIESVFVSSKDAEAFRDPNGYVEFKRSSYF